ncbi:unnamed protein product, partial [Scytosiphon promiscuus]
LLPHSPRFFTKHLPTDFRQLRAPLLTLDVTHASTNYYTMAMRGLLTLLATFVVLASGDFIGAHALNDMDGADNTKIVDRGNVHFDGGHAGARGLGGYGGGSSSSDSKSGSSSSDSKSGSSSSSS